VLLITLVTSLPSVAAFLGVVAGLMGGCDCPCRTYTTKRCVPTYKERCEPVGFDDMKCTKHPAVVAKFVKETECRKCQEFSEVGMTERSKLKCNQVYDETCSTVYVPHCAYEKQCSTYYAKDCSQAEYGGPCHSLPVEKCKKIKKCHRTPETRCKPAKRMECGLDNILVPKKRKKQNCLPFSAPPPPEEECGEAQTYLPPSFPKGPETYALVQPVDAPIGQEGEFQTYLPPSLPKGPQTYALIEPVDAPHGYDNQVSGVFGTSPGDTYGSPLGPAIHEEPIPFAEPDNSYGPPLPPPYSTIGLPPFVEDYPPSYAMVEAVPDPRPSYGSPHGGVTEDYKTPSYQESYGSPHGGIKRDSEDFLQISREYLGSSGTYHAEVSQNTEIGSRPKRLQNSQAEERVLPPVLQAAASRNSVSLPESVKQKESDDASHTPPFLPTPAPLTATTPQTSFASPSSFPPPVRSYTFYSSPRPLAPSTESPSPLTKTLSRFLFSPSSSSSPPPPLSSSRVLSEDTFTPSRAGPVFLIRRLGERD